MKVGVYIDGYNLYYGGRTLFGGNPGWKWLDLRVLSERFTSWQDSSLDRIVFCTARVNDPAEPTSRERQDFYLQALKAHSSVNVIEEGYFSSWAKESVMANEPGGTRAPTPLRDPDGKLSWSPDLNLRRTTDGVMLATIRKREEKGSDVNVATHLLNDVLTAQVEGAIVISNDSDLALPLSIARKHVPVGLINPSSRPLAGALKGHATEGKGGHWWRRLNQDDFLKSQLPQKVGNIVRPAGW